MNKYLTFKELPDGNLKISLTKEGRVMLKETLASDKWNHLSVWADLLESYSCNGSYTVIPPQAVGALTDSVIIADDVTVGDNGEYETVGNVYWFPEYMVVNEFEKLLKNQLIFTKAD